MTLEQPEDLEKEIDFYKMLIKGRETQIPILNDMVNTTPAQEYYIRIGIPIMSKEIIQYMKLIDELEDRLNET